MKTLLLDSEPLGIMAHSQPTASHRLSMRWMSDHLEAKNRLIIPEIIFFEVRRELKRAKKFRSLDLLDFLCEQLEYLPLTTPAMRLASDLWADVRSKGMPTSDPKALDADSILAAQALLLDPSAIVATSNLVHLSRMAPAAIWDTIDP